MECRDVIFIILVAPSDILAQKTCNVVRLVVEIDLVTFIVKA